MAFDPKGTEFYPWLSFTLIVFSPYCAIFKSFDWLKISRSSLQPRSKIKTKTGFDMCAHFTSLFLCFFYGFWFADWIVCAWTLWLGMVITCVLLCLFERKAAGDNNESCSKSPLYFDSNYIPVKPIYLELLKVLGLFRELSYQRRVVEGSRGSYTIDQFWPKCPRTLKLLLTLASHTNTWPSFDPVTKICPLQS